MRKLLLFFCLTMVAGAYTPPTGIPNPSVDFGYHIDRVTPPWPASWTAGTPSATAGYYYVDKTAVGATNTSNPNGYPGHARLNIPEGTLAAGAFIYVHAGTYGTADSSNDRFIFNANGTTDSPVWITGNPAAHPTFQDKVGFGVGASCHYVIIENFDFSRGASTKTGKIEIRPTTSGNTIDHVLIRNCYFNGAQAFDDGSAVGIGGGATAATTVSYVVVYNCTILNYGVMQRTGSTEDCGVYKDYRTDHCWVLGCDISRVGADCVAGSHSANSTDATSTYYFIGDNILHESGENAIDLKGTRYVVISHNTCYGPFVREQGWCIVLHSGASPPTAVQDAWVIFNKLHTASAGVVTTSTNGANNIGVVGNVIWNQHGALAEGGISSDPFLGNCGINISALHGTSWVANNTVYDCDEGIKGSASTTPELLNKIKFHANLIASISGGGNSIRGMDSGNAPYLDADYDLFPNPPVIVWDGASKSLATLQGTYGEELNVVTSNSPAFTDSVSFDFTLQGGSPAVDAAVEGPVGDTAYDAFFALWGTSIKVDFNGITRPQGGGWDIGAYEYGGPVGSPRSYALPLRRRR